MGTTKKLYPLDEIVRLAAKRGVDFGKASPYNRIRYYTKFGLLPHAKKRSFAGQAPSAAYPIEVVDKIVQIEKSRQRGKSVFALTDKKQAPVSTPLPIQAQETQTPRPTASQELELPEQPRFEAPAPINITKTVYISQKRSNISSRSLLKYINAFGFFIIALLLLGLPLFKHPETSKAKVLGAEANSDSAFVKIGKAIATPFAKADLNLIKVLKNDSSKLDQLGLTNLDLVVINKPEELAFQKDISTNSLQANYINGHQLGTEANNIPTLNSDGDFEIPGHLKAKIDWKYIENAPAFGNSVTTTYVSSSGTITQVIAGVGLVGGGSSGSVTLSLSSSVTLQGNTFNTANKLVKLNGSGALPALSGANLTNLNAGNISSGILSVGHGGTGISSIGSNGSLVYSNGTTYAFSAVGSLGDCLLSNGGGAPTWGSCGAATSIDVTDGTTTVNGATTLTFNGSDFNVSGPSPNATIALDYTNSHITRDNVGATVTAAWILSNVGNSFTGNFLVAPGQSLDTSAAGTLEIGPTNATLINLNTDTDAALSGTENFRIFNSSVTDSSFNVADIFAVYDAATSATEQYVVSIANADDAGGTTGIPDALVNIANTDTNEAVPVGIRFFAATGGGITTGIDLTDTDVGTGIALGANDITGTTAVINFSNFDVATTGNITVAAGQGLDTNAAGNLNIGVTNVGTNTIAIGPGAATAATIDFVGGSGATGCSIAGDTGNLSCSGTISGSSAYLAKNTHDTSSASYLGNLYDFTNSNAGAAGVLSLSNSGTNSALYITQSGNPSANQAAIFAINSNGTPSGNLIDLQVTAGSRFSVDVSGNLDAAGFGNFGSNASLSASKVLNIDHDTTLSGSYGIYDKLNYTGTNVNASATGLVIAAQNSASAGSSLVTLGINLQSIQNSTQPISSLEGQRLQLSSTGSGSGGITLAFGLRVMSPSWGNAVAGTAYGIQINNQGNASTTTTTGLYIAGQTAGTTSYGINIDTSAGSATTKTAINVASGWDQALKITNNTSTTPDGVVGITVDSIANNNSALKLSYTANDSVAVTTQTGIDLTFTNNDTSAGADAFYGQRITNANNASLTNVTTALLNLDNLDTSTSSVTNGILFSNSGGTAQSFDYGLNFDAANSFAVSAINSALIDGILLNNSYPSATNQNAALTAINLNLSSNLTVSDAASGNQTGINLTLKDGGTSATAKGLVIGGTYDTAIDIAGISSAASGTLNGINIGNFTGNGATINVLNIGTASGSGTKTTINIGTGWNNAINSPGFIVSGAGHVAIGANAAINTTEVLEVKESIADDTCTSSCPIGGFFEMTNNTTTWSGFNGGGAIGVKGRGKFDASNANSFLTGIIGGLFQAQYHNTGIGGHTYLAGIEIQNSSLSGNTGAIGGSYGLRIQAPTWTSGAPLTTYGIDIASQGSSSTTTSYGINIANQGNASSTTAAGIVIAGQTAGTTSYGIQIANSAGSATTKNAIQIGTGWDTSLNITGVSAAGKGVNIVTSSLTTGTALNIAATSALISSGNLISADITTTSSTSTAVTGNLLNLNRDMTLTGGVDGQSVTFDATSNGKTAAGGATSVSFSHTIGSGTKRILIVGISQSANAAITSVQYNSSNMTAIPSCSNLTSNQGVVMYYMTDSTSPALPAAGAYNVVVNWGSTQAAVVGAISYYNVDQTTPLGTCAIANGSSTTPQVTVGSNAGDTIVDTLFVNSNPTTTPNGSQTQRWNTTADFIGFPMTGAGSTKPGATTSTSMDWTLSASATWRINGVAVKANSIQLSGALASFSSACSGCTDSSNILALNQSFSTAAGDVLNITNSGTGSAISIDNTTTITIPAQSFINIGGTITHSSTGNTGQLYGIDFVPTINMTADPGSASGPNTFRDLTFTNLTNGVADTSTHTSMVEYQIFNVAQTNTASNSSIAGVTGYLASNAFCYDYQTDYTAFNFPECKTNSGSGTFTVSDYRQFWAKGASDSLGLGVLGVGDNVVVTNNYGLDVTGQVIKTGGTVTNLYGVHVANTTPTGTLTNQYGLYIDNLTGGGTVDYGIYLGGADTAGICFDCDGTYSFSTVSAGIKWGSDAGAASIYRAASNALTLATSSNGNINITPNGTGKVVLSTQVNYNVASAGPSCASLANGDFGYDSTNNRIFWKGTGGTCSYWNRTGTFDIAERAPASEPLEPGDLVAIDTSTTSFTVKKSDEAYQKTILGVESTDPTFIDNPDSLGNPQYLARLALAGRVPTKVSTENGPIEPGDPITSSSVTGVGMKATSPGPIIGKALVAYTGSEVGKILVLISPSYYSGPTESALISNVARLQLDSQNNLVATISAGTSFVWKNTTGTVVASISDLGEAVFSKVTAAFADFGQLIFGELVAKKNAHISGESVILAGADQIEIPTDKVKADSLINLTLTSGPDSIVSVTDKKAGQSFTVSVHRLDPNSQSEVKFTWLIVNQQ